MRCPGSWIPPVWLAQLGSRLAPSSPPHTVSPPGRPARRLKFGTLGAPRRCGRLRRSRPVAGDVHLAARAAPGQALGPHRPSKGGYTGVAHLAWHGASFAVPWYPFEHRHGVGYDSAKQDRGAAGCDAPAAQPKEPGLPGARPAGPWDVSVVKPTIGGVASLPRHAVGPCYGACRCDTCAIGAPHSRGALFNSLPDQFGGRRGRAISRSRI